MTKLKELVLVSYERPNNSDPKLKRRRKLLDKLQEQMRLAEDSTYQPTTNKWVTDTYGERKRLEVPKRVKRWQGARTQTEIQSLPSVTAASPSNWRR